MASRKCQNGTLEVPNWPLEVEEDQVEEEEVEQESGRACEARSDGLTPKPEETSAGQEPVEPSPVSEITDMDLRSVSLVTGEDGKPTFGVAGTITGCIPSGKPVGVLARRQDRKKSSRLDRDDSLVLGGKPRKKISAPTSDLGTDVDDPRTKVDLWHRFQAMIAESSTTYDPPARPTGRELGNCATLMSEYKTHDILRMFEMIVKGWAVVCERWPRVAKTPVPTFYAAFTLRRELIAMVQAGEALTSRTHRAGDTSKDPAVGWGK